MGRLFISLDRNWKMTRVEYLARITERELLDVP
jgi:hypothetical protein